MATLVKTPSGTWKAVVRKNGWPTNIKTFRTKRDAEDWGTPKPRMRCVRGVHIVRATAERLTLAEALKRYTAEVTPTKRPASQEGELRRAAILARISANTLLPLSTRDRGPLPRYATRRRDRKDENGMPIPAPTTRPLELAPSWTLVYDCHQGMG